MIDFTAVLNDLDGAAISDGGETKSAFTLGSAAVRALVIPYEDERNLSPEENSSAASSPPAFTGLPRSA